MKDDSLDLLFVTRKFPPSTGGMQEFSYHLYESLQRRDDAKIDGITWGGSNIWLPVVLPLLFLRTLWNAVRKRPDVLYCTDGLLSPLALIVKRFTGIPTVITVYGLDITYDNWLYQKGVVSTFDRHDAVACISTAAQEKAIEAGVSETKTHVIPGGVDPEKYFVPGATEADAERVLRENGYDIALQEKTVLLSVGRLVRRKGFQWFADSVVPRLPDEYVYVICGSGPMQEEIQHAIERHSLEGRVIPLGRVTGEPLHTLYSTADLLIMPNIPVENDMEGFGLVAMEAASCGTPVIAADMEGMKDSVIPGTTGIRVTPESPSAFIDAIEDVAETLPSRDEIRSYVVEEFGWDAQAGRYTDLFRTVVEAIGDRP